MQSKAATVPAYLASLPADRRAAIEAVRAMILKHIDKGFEEGMQYGMIGYFVPHAIFPPGYHCDPKQPLPYAGLASQKQHMSLYLMGIYGQPALRAWFEEAWARTGKRLDMGAACIRFKRLEDLALEVIAAALRKLPLRAYIDQYQAALDTRRPTKPAAQGKVAKTSAKKVTTKAAKKAMTKATTKATTKGTAKVAKKVAKTTARAGAKPSTGRAAATKSTRSRG
jgi:hypothetical protein